jgi:hypothetical protein
MHFLFWRFAITVIPWLTWHCEKSPQFFPLPPPPPPSNFKQLDDYKGQIRSLPGETMQRQQ